MLALWGMEPYPGGNRRFISLNYVDVDIANQYQLLRVNRGILPDQDDPKKDGGEDDDDTQE